MPATLPTPRQPLPRLARFRLAYNLYGWKILLSVLFALAAAGFAAWVIFSVKYPAARKKWDEQITIAEMVENDGSIFESEMLYSAAHHYAADHNNKLPASAAWESALAPYLARANAKNAVLSNKHRFVMNRALSGDTLFDVPDPSRTLLFWEAATAFSELPPSAYQNASDPFLGVTCDGTPVYATPTGKPNEPPLLRRAQYSRPRTK